MKKIFKKLSLILALVLLVLSFTACGSEEYVHVVGNPSAERFKEGQVARCVWDMYVYDGKIFIGGGDYSANTRPADIWAYDLSSGTWSKSGTVEDEAISRFTQIDGKLVATGIDPSEDWTMGNYYVYKNGTWEKKRVLPNAVHNFDMVEFDGKIFAAIGVDTGYTPFVCSTDGGLTFNHLQMYKNFNQIDLTKDYGENYLFSRAYEFLKYNGKLYAVVRHTFQEYDAFNNPTSEKYETELFEYKNGGMHSVTEATSKFNVFGTGLNLFGAKAEFNGYMYFCSDHLYVTEDFENFDKINLPENEVVSSFLIENGKMYILAVKKVGETYSNRVYVTDNGQNGFTEVFCFDYAVPAISFVKVEQDFYMGMGYKLSQKQNNGDVVKVDTTKDKTHSNECVFYL